MSKLKEDVLICSEGTRKLRDKCISDDKELSFKKLNQEWFGRPESTLKYFVKKYGKEEMLKIFAKII